MRLATGFAYQWALWLIVIHGNWKSLNDMLSRIPCKADGTWRRILQTNRRLNSDSDEWSRWRRFAVAETINRRTSFTCQKRAIFSWKPHNLHDTRDSSNRNFAVSFVPHPKTWKLTSIYVSHVAIKRWYYKAPAIRFSPLPVNSSLSRWIFSLFGVNWELYIVDLIPHNFTQLHRHQNHIFYCSIGQQPTLAKLEFNGF